MWQINFAASPETLPELDHTLRVDERMLRWLVLKRRPYAPLPSPYRLARTAANVTEALARQQQAAAASNQQ
jgi:ribosomal protein S6